MYVGQQDQDGDGINDAFETNPEGKLFSVENTPEARSRDKDAWGERAHRTDWDETPGAWLSFRNEDHVKGENGTTMNAIDSGDVRA